MSTQTLARTGQNGAVAKPSGKATLETLFSQRQGELAQIAAEGMSVHRLFRTFLQCVSKTPKLQGCTAESLYRAMQDAAEVGLEPGGALGLAYLVPYGDQCEYQIGYRGYIELARRSGLVNHVHPVAVFRSDIFEYEMGLNPILKHKPLAGSRKPADLVYVYAIAHFANGSAQFDVMTKDECDAIRTRSKSGTNGPWVTDYAEMCKKTVLRRICKVLPRSIAVKDNLMVAADGRVHRTEPLRMGASGPMMIEEPVDLSDEEFEPADVSGPPSRPSSRPKSDAQRKAESDEAEQILRAALTVEAARIWSSEEYELSLELATRILDRPCADVATDWEKWHARDFVRILCYAMHQGRIIPLTEDIPEPNGILAEAQQFGLAAA